MTLHIVALVVHLWVVPATVCPVPAPIPQEEHMTFSEAFDRLMEWEGGGQLHEDSRGILTKWGVASSAHPDVDVANLTKEEAMRIARELYWQPALIAHLPDDLRYPVFDLAYNAGTSRAVRTLQKALNDVALARMLHRPMLAVDGMPGPNTRARLYSLRDRGETQFIKRCFINRRADFYTALLETDPEEYGPSYNGWLRRALGAV